MIGRPATQYQKLLHTYRAKFPGRDSKTRLLKSRYDQHYCSFEDLLWNPRSKSRLNLETMFFRSKIFSK